MAVRARGRSASVAILRKRDFSGGLNVRDAASALADNEAPDAWNVTLDERGGVGKRLGFEKWNTTAFGVAGDLVKLLFFWEAGQALITQAGASLYKEQGGTAFKTFTTAARVGLADFQGRLYMIHPVDGLFHYDGTTVTAVSDPDAPKGDVLAPWQTKLYSAGNPTNAPRVSWSAIGDGAVWAAADWVDLREKDGEKVVALAGASGIDISGRQGLLAFKRESTYRIHDSATGAYATLDTSIGAGSAVAAENVSGRTVTVSEHGIYWTDGLSAMREASARVRPLFTPGRLNFAQLDLFACGREGDRVRISVPQAGQTKNDLAFEYHPDQGWIVPGSNAMACYAVYGKDSEYTVGGHPSTDGRVYRLNKTGSDDGAAIASRFQSRWFEPADGILASLLRIRLHGRGAFNLYVRKDYAVTGGDLRAVAISAAPPKYDAGLKYDAGHKYGPSRTQEFDDVHSLGTCKAFSLRIEETSALLGTGQQLLGQGATPEVGAWSLYGFDLNFVPLGLA